MAKKNEEPLKVRDFGFDITSDHLGRVNPEEIKHGQIWLADGLKAYIIVDPTRAPYLNIRRPGIFMVPLKAEKFELISVPTELRKEFLYVGTMDIIAIRGMK